MGRPATPASAPRAGGGHYDRLTIALHWTVMLLVAAVWLLGQLITSFPTAVRPPLWSLHIVLGIVLGGVLVLRLAWRLTAGRQLPPSDHGWLHVAVQATHYGLYALLAGAVLAGLATAWTRGSDVFGLFAFPEPGFADRATKQTTRGLHALAANWLVILAGLHAAAALFHHYVLHDGVLRRMLPGGASG